MYQLWVLTSDQVWTVVLSMIIAVIIAVTLPRLRFSLDKPLPSYPRWWIATSGIMAIPVSYGLTFLANESTGLGFLTSIAFVAGIGSVSAWTDYTYHRIPNFPVAILYIGVGTSLTIDAILTGNWSGLLWSFIGLLAVGAWFTVMAITGMGIGDLKLFTIIAAPIAYISGSLTLVWVITAYCISAVYGIMLLIGGAGRKGKMPMAPPFILSLMLVPGLIGMGAAVIW